MIWKNYSYITATSMGATITGSAIDLTQYFGCSLQAVWSGTPAGNFTIEYSNDNVTYTSDAASSVAAGGASGSQIYNLFEQYSKYARLVYTRSGSTGTLDVQLNGKGF